MGYSRSRFNGLPLHGKLLKQFHYCFALSFTGLKPRC